MRERSEETSGLKGLFAVILITSIAGAILENKGIIYGRFEDGRNKYVGRQIVLTYQPNHQNYKN